MTTNSHNKIVLIGDTSVGKSSIVQRLKYNTFNENKDVTIGAAFCSHIVNINNKQVVLNLWDTAGQEKYNFFIPMFLRDAKVVLICFSGNDLNDIERYVKAANDHNPELYILLVATKVDKNNNIDFSIKHYARMNDFDIYLTSAKENKGINELFEHIADYITKRPEDDNKDTFQLLDDEPKTFNCCWQ